MEKHLTEAEFERYLNGEISLLEKIRFRRHLESCEACRNLKSTLQNRQNFLREFRQGISRIGEAERKVETLCRTSCRKYEE